MWQGKRISVVIPAFNEEAGVANVVRGFLETGVVDEIVVADNNSTDGTKELARALAGKLGPMKVRYVFEGRQGKTYALNTAIREASGEVVVFSDDDVVFDKDWLVKIDQFIRSNDFDAAGGRILPKFPADTPEWVKRNIDQLSGPIVTYDYGPETKLYDRKRMNPLVGTNMLVKRRLFDEVGLFNTNLGPGAGTFGDDTEICLRWEKKNKKLFYLGGAMVWHPVVRRRMSLKYIAQWNMAYGKYEVVRKKGALDQNVVCVAGVPRYLFREIISNGMKVVFYWFNRRKFLKHWISLFREIGAALAYREMHGARTGGRQ